MAAPLGLSAGRVQELGSREHLSSSRCQVLEQGANPWSAVQCRDLEMQRDGCCKLGEGRREALPRSAALSASILLWLL